MNKSQREAVVELLRCAADRDVDFDDEEVVNGTSMAVWEMHGPNPRGRKATEIWDLAIEALRECTSEEQCDVDYRGALLETALLVEEGEWP